MLRAAGVLACTGVGRVVFSKSTLIALLGALADGDALEFIRPLEETGRYFSRYREERQNLQNRATR